MNATNHIIKRMNYIKKKFQNQQDAKRWQCKHICVHKTHRRYYMILKKIGYEVF